MGLLEVQKNKYKKNAPHVKLLVDFSKEQPEEAEYLAEKEREYEEAMERWAQAQEQKEKDKRPAPEWDEDGEFPF